MPNDAATEKAGSAEHGDGATVRCHHDSNSPVYVGASHCLWSRNPSGRLSNRSILLAMMKSFSCSPLIFLVFRETVAQPQPNVWVMAFCLGKLTDFPKNAERFPEIVESNGPLD